MSGQVFLLGATGYTGELTARAMAARGMQPVLVGRDRAGLSRLAAQLGGLQTADADLSHAPSVRALAGRGDVLVTLVGPFLRWGEPAARAATENGAHYLDSNGEPPFTRLAFERYGPAAAEAGILMLPSFGWECVLGNLAGALALRESGEDAVRLDTGYFYVGTTGSSGGTRASFAAAMPMPSFAYRDGALRTVRAGDRYRRMPVDGRGRPGIAFGASEHLALPRSFPQLEEVNAYLGWFGGLPGGFARALHLASGPGSAALKAPGVRSLFEAATRWLARGSSGGPSAGERAAGAVHVVGIAYDRRGAQLAEVHLGGAEGYEFTASILAWGAERVAAGRFEGTGALGPVEAFGLDQLEQGCAEAGVGRLRGGAAYRDAPDDRSMAS